MYDDEDEFEISINEDEWTEDPLCEGPFQDAVFWARYNGKWVALELEPGECISLRIYQRHDEGYTSSVETWRHCGNYIRREWSSRGRDCDGVMTSGGEDCCRVSDLPPVQWPARDNAPKWTDRIDAPIYDQYAQAAGY